MNGSAARRGQKLLYVTFPTVLQKGRVKVINGLPTAAKGEPIINVSDISKLVEIPPLETITEARDVLLKANEEAQIQEGPRSSRTPAPWGVQVSNFGSFNANVLSILPKIFDVKNFVRDLRTLLRWLNDEASKHDPAFSKWFEGILLNERGIMQYNFEASGVVMRIHSLCFFPFEDLSTMTQYAES